MENSFEGVKLPYDLLPAKAIHEVVEVLEFGKNKYGAHNWRTMYSKEDEQKLYAAALRHMFAWQRGELPDGQTHIDHLAHAACNLLFLVELKHIRKENENGSKKESHFKRCGNQIHTTD